MPIAPLALKQFKLFGNLPDPIIAELSQHAQFVDLPRRKVVMQKNKTGHSLGLLVSGRLQGVDMTLDGKEAGLYFIEPNDFFGELSVIDNLPASEYIICISPAKVINIPATIIRAILKTSPDVATIINARLARRLRESISQRTLLSMPSPLQRVSAQLIHLTPDASQSDTVIADAPTHQEIAIMINTTRETVTRVFQTLQKKGLIKRNGSTLVVLNLKKLRLLATDSENA
ncbi:MAG: Crp/Fnr family transcriptional regulator [Methylophilaceae bacterium]